MSSADSNTSITPLHPLHALFQSKLDKKGFYLGAPDLLERVEWVRDGYANRLVEKVQKPNEEQESLSSSEEGAPMAHQAAVLSVAVRIAAEDLWIASDGGWTASEKQPAKFVDVKLTFTGALPHLHPFNDDYFQALENARALQTAIATKGITKMNGFVVTKKPEIDSLQRFRFRHALFKSLDDPDNSDEEDESEEEDNQSLNGVQDTDHHRYTIHNWPVVTPQATDALQALQKNPTHRVRPLIALNTVGKQIPPNNYRRALEGAIVAVQFTLSHYFIAKGSYDSIVADIVCIDVLRGPMPSVSSPKKRKHSLRGHSESPAKKRGQS